MKDAELAGKLRELADDDELVFEIHKRIEDVLIMMRDSGMFVIAGNGLVCREKNGDPSGTIRISTRNAIRSVLKDAADLVE